MSFLTRRMDLQKTAKHECKGRQAFSYFRWFSGTTHTGLFRAFNCRLPCVKQVPLLGRIFGDHMGFTQLSSRSQSPFFPEFHSREFIGIEVVGRLSMQRQFPCRVFPQQKPRMFFLLYKFYIVSTPLGFQSQIKVQLQIPYPSSLRFSCW